MSGWPMVGRSATVREIVAAAHSERWSGVVLVGAPGVGRTRLARAALAAICANRQGWAPYWVMASRSTATLPLGALAHLLPDLDPGAPRPQLLRDARRWLLEGAGDARPVLAIDDAHELDETSAILLLRLAGSGDAFVVVTAPSGVRVPPPVFALWKEGLAERVDLAALDRAQSDRLVVEALTGDGDGSLVDAGALDRLWRLARGNPLFLRELVEGGRAAGTLHRSGSVWRWAGAFPGTPRLTEMLEAQLGAPDGAERDLLRLLAFGEPLASEIAAALAGPDVLAAAEARGVVTSVRNEHRVELRLTHPLHAEILRGRASPLQEREAYRRLSEAAGRVDGGRPPGGRALAWRVAQGLPVPAGELLDAADELAVADPPAAARLLGAVTGADTGTRLRLARSWIRLGQAERAEAVLTGAPERDGPGGAVVRVHNLYWGLRAFDRAGEVLRAATAAPGTGEPQVVLQAFRELLEGRSEEGARIAATAADAPGAGTAALSLAALASARAGRYEAAVGYARRADPPPATDVTGADEAGGWLRFQLLAAWWYALLQTGDLDGADGLARPAHRAALAAGRERHAALFGTWLGIVDARRGRLRTATAQLLEAAAAVPASRFSFAVPLVGELAVALAASGRVKRARAVLAEGDRIPGDMLLSGWVRPARVFLAGVQGRTSHAATLAIDAACDTGCARGHRAQALHAAVRCGITGEVADRLAALADGAEGPLERAYGAHARALAGRDGAGLDTVAARFDELGHRLLAAEAAAQAAAVYRAAGRTGPAGAAASRARAWAQECEGAATPALALLEGTDDLTPREHEIAALAASGMTSRAIAGELVVSVRTVDNVLRSVYAKLGVSGRGDLTRIAGLGSRS
ncbi:LuxR family transcriptional regulator [Pseudonocardia sp. C8]|uniref:helix-turn-helix transcriptional regulator n=1 Tax=Pseudonocardia sp. C8 TaxID=2762759 RepID=UPI0016433772|nr:helix-turn-helix transcriptional regulator [Pseudonocardia sp. C8]MBC3190531.1 LuxR family transcriptional regulator [Pseudonocardia sp. C8]